MDKKPTQIEQTAKPLKFAMALGALIFFAALYQYVDNPGADAVSRKYLTMAGGCGLGIFFAAKISAWWNHG